MMKADMILLEEITVDVVVLVVLAFIVYLASIILNF